MSGATNGVSEVENLQQEVTYRTRLQDICNKIYAAVNLDDIIIHLKDEIKSLFEAERITIYYVDGVKREIVSRFKTGTEIDEIRLSITTSSIAGYSVLKKSLLNIKDVHDNQELAAIDPSITFDSSWDRRTGFVTRQMLVVPILYKTYLLGAVQLMNRKQGDVFTAQDEENLQEIAKIIGIALYNQKRAARNKKSKFDYLLENHIMTQKELSQAERMARETGETVEKVLLSRFNIPKGDVGEALSRYYKAPFVEYNSSMPIPGELLEDLKVPFMRNNHWVPLRSEGDKVVIIVDDPHDAQKMGQIRVLFPGRELEPFISFREDILNYITLFTQDEKQQSSIDEIISQLADEEDEIEEAESGLSEESSVVVQLVNKIIIDAYNRGVSDIHIEPYPGKENTKVRFRTDGACSVYQTIPYQYRNAIVSRLKIMCDLDIAERRKPQDGKIKFKRYGGLDVELRVATVPTQGGMEDVVLRILAAGEPIPLEDMRFSDRNFDKFVEMINKPYGIIFVCGPTGSGKTTTLHSALAKINDEERKIWTAEDPVEITQKGLRQVQVQQKIGFDFAAAMRAFLRADPDVIMVGEMRDRETTHIGIEASLTGHLVFSTLHTNSAPESITRLLDMGMDPFNFADAILCILAQRLVRTLCKDCKEEYHPSRDEYDELVREFGSQEEFDQFLNIPYSDDLMLHRPKGCDKCSNTGYRGRMGIHELLEGTDEMRKLIQTSARMEELRDQAVRDGMTSLKQDGIAKIFQGYCDLLQVRKVCIK
ncbi:GspE/PulE family protein [Desulfoluna butyratoxydans]|uniref:Type ii secretion system protein e n=1 Tax=Desulfoluna butyratoxydans TaxID=231438 RepID=A0A4U8YSK9_9BACT|nr:GspE/PulE family protein [Desulfoluna butyratoxydans]VFQ47366.1 type ii secretion system protein e [Desulfoluna butyratoxydans]